MKRKDNLRIGQIIVLNQVQGFLVQMTATLMHLVEHAPVVAQTVDEEDLPVNSAHIRAAGLAGLDAVEQIVQALTDDGEWAEEDEIQEMLEGLQEELDKCREALTQEAPE